MDENTPQKSVADLNAFIEKTSFYSRLCNMFFATMAFDIPEGYFNKQMWLDIFAQPIVYPPPLNHPLCSAVS
jgi:hypothetical protein